MREKELPENSYKEIVSIKSETSSKFINSLERLIKFYYFFKKSDFDIIHFHAVSPGIPSASLLIAAKFAGKKNIILHSHMGTKTSDITGTWRVKWLIGRYLTSHLADVLVACSDQAVEYGFSPGAIKKRGFRIIKNGIDTKRFKFNPTVRKYWREKLNINRNYVMGSVARFADFKNHTFMLDILYELQGMKDNACLLLVGDSVSGEETIIDMIKDKARKLGIFDRIIFYGQSDCPEGLLQAMDVFIMPSTREGFGIAALEAQCAGLKVVASDRITTMLKTTDNIIFLPLELGAREWARCVSICNDGYLRIDYSDRVRDNGFDIADTAKELENLYLEFNK